MTHSPRGSFRGRCLSDFDIRQIPVVSVKAPAHILTRRSCLGAAFTTLCLVSGSERFLPAFAESREGKQSERVCDRHDKGGR